ncbi:MAG: ATP phosphoribosyltransferase [Bacteroidia bacterium]|nr:ATP phosphoribosyltransferase [Bacteroidia bacterium]
MMQTLKIALQKTGRLSELSLGLVGEAGISLTNGKRTLLAQSSTFPLEVLYLRDDDIPQYVADGVADAGIIGEDVMMESQYPLEVLLRLGFSRCRLSIAVPKEQSYTGLNWLNNKKIATSFPNILKTFLIENQINAEIHYLNGSVEIAPAIGLADCIFDIVSSGSTLISNGLRETEVIMESEAVLVAAPGLSDEKRSILNDFLFRIKSVLAARDKKYILLNAPNDKLDEICRVLPGMKSPTIMPLALEGWSSVHSVLSENKFWSIINQLKEAGAQGILVIPIEKMIL